MTQVKIDLPALRAILDEDEEEVIARMLMSYIDEIIAERDAAVSDLHKALRSEVGSPCDLCLYDAEAPDGMGLLQHWRVAE